MEKNTKFFEIGRYGEKIGQKYLLKYFDPPPPFPMEQKKMPKMKKKIKVVPNWLKWQENCSEIIFEFFYTTPTARNLWTKQML